MLNLLYDFIYLNINLFGFKTDLYYVIFIELGFYTNHMYDNWNSFQVYFCILYYCLISYAFHDFIPYLLQFLIISNVMQTGFTKQDKDSICISNVLLKKNNFKKREAFDIKHCRFVYLNGLFRNVIRRR